MLRKKKAQGTLEYVIVFTAIIAAVVALAVILGKKEPTGEGGVGKLMKQAGDRIQTDSGKVADMVK